MSEKTTVTNPSDNEQGTTTPAIPVVPEQPPLTPEDKMILNAALQDIANELRRIKRERKNQEHHEETNPQ